MFRIWIKTIKENRLINDTVICDDTNDTRTHKVLNSVDKACEDFDLSRPIWLDSNIAEFKRISKTRFNHDNFIDSIDFDYMEVQILEED